jgi:hypothetical protein
VPEVGPSTNVEAPCLESDPVTGDCTRHGSMGQFVSEFLNGRATYGGASLSPDDVLRLGTTHGDKSNVSVDMLTPISSVSVRCQVMAVAAVAAIAIVVVKVFRMGGRLSYAPIGDGTLSNVVCDCGNMDDGPVLCNGTCERARETLLTHLFAPPSCHQSLTISPPRQQRQFTAKKKARNKEGRRQRCPRQLTLLMTRLEFELPPP